MADNSYYEHYIKQGTADVNQLKKDITFTSQDVSRAILDMSKMANVMSGGYVSSVNVPPVGNTIVYSGSAGGAGAYYPYLANWVETPPVDTEALAERIATRYVPGETLVVCVDNELTSTQIDEISAQLLSRKIEGLIIRGAKAGTGRPAGQPKSSPQWRIDILARIAETWERHPDLTFAELIRWWSGENMTDDDFAAATDVYAKKVYE